ncbi:hypothetical protein LTR37_008264 [Vermiconidia calcicola]|uniref:Uncharacterized protein n=1 Tax=Vermiconidia calcicola TaxID=1690605 RepID=A0ACC3NBP9_9PEZI|nr:hypothetical protein LTR37_008264 [Vermiconidia calcicola]
MSSPIPRLHLMCVHEEDVAAFKKACDSRKLPSFVSVAIHECSLSQLESTVQFDLIVSPANSYGRLDGGFDNAISRAFSPRDDYLALTRVAQSKLYEQWRGFAPPGTCTLVRIPDDFTARSKNIWGTKHLALLPTMRVPQDVRWDHEVVYECMWSLLCAIDKHNQDRNVVASERISSLLMTPLATATGGVSAQKWASQCVLAIKHFVDAIEHPQEWSHLEWKNAGRYAAEVKATWTL